MMGMPKVSGRGAGLRLWGRFARDGSGAIAVEFSLLAFPFFLVIFAILETSLVFLGDLTLDHAVERVSREIRVGAIKPTDEKTFKSSLCKQVSVLLSCDKLVSDVRSYNKYSDIEEINIAAGGDLDSSGFKFDPKGSSAITTVRVYYKWPIVTDIFRKYLSDMSDGSHLLAATSAFRIENY